MAPMTFLPINKYRLYRNTESLRGHQTNKFIRAGIGSSSVIGAASNRVGGYRSWETFDIYDLGNRNGLDGGTYALRSSQDPIRWVSVMNNIFFAYYTD